MLLANGAAGATGTGTTTVNSGGTLAGTGTTGAVTPPINPPISLSTNQML